ncbi:glycosyltransferase family 2 protein [Aeromicrobium sp. 179-A 4D2 NHS]|uniref:glycosyltransferase family 2 protein n=1 Tax=Aeromicrobium sp. 179-A 4D2 NHS TaxID=3142375 RepID=UPI0039A1C7BB
MTSAVTTVVITRDRLDQLRATLPRHRAPVVVVDNGSRDGTVEYVREHHPGVRVVALAENLAGAARTLGVRAAATPFVAFADDDSWWEPGALDRAADVLSGHPGIAVLAARVLVEPGAREDPFNAVLADSPLTDAPDLPGVPVLGFMACASVVRRDAFLAAGGFSRLLGIGGEEQVLAWDLAARGLHLRYEPSLVAHHEPRPSPSRGSRRTRSLRRAALTAAVLRRPWTDVARIAVRGLLASPADRAGVAAALLDLPAALRERRPLPPDVLARIHTLGD